MTWKSFHHREEVLRAVVDAADRRRDGKLPLDLPGVSETFGDPLTLLGALQLRWHTRLAGQIERQLMSQPIDLEDAVVTAWRSAAATMPGVRAVVDHHRCEPLDAEMAKALDKATEKEHAMLALMAGLASGDDAAAVRAGKQLESRARTSHRQIAPDATPASAERPGLLDRIRSVLAA